MTARRLTTIQNADRIIVMDKSGIIEQGRHEELLSAENHDANLYNLHASL